VFSYTRHKIIGYAMFGLFFAFSALDFSRCYGKQTTQIWKTVKYELL